MAHGEVKCVQLQNFWNHIIEKRANYRQALERGEKLGEQHKKTKVKTEIGIPKIFALHHEYQRTGSSKNCGHEFWVKIAICAQSGMLFLQVESKNQIHDWQQQCVHESTSPIPSGRYSCRKMREMNTTHWVLRRGGLRYFVMTYVDEELVRKYNSGKSRSKNPEYSRR